MSHIPLRGLLLIFFDSLKKRVLSYIFSCYWVVPSSTFSMYMAQRKVHLVYLKSLTLNSSYHLGILNNINTLLK